MSETNTYHGTLKVKRNIRPSFGDVFFAWAFYGLFRYWSVRFLLPWGIWGAILHYFLLFSAISLTARALFIPRYRYEFHREVEPESDATDIASESIKSETSESVNDSSTTETVAKPSTISPSEKKEEKIVEKSKVEVKTTPKPEIKIVKEDVMAKPEPVKPKKETEVKSRIEDGIQFCSYCGVQNPDYARFCSTCGERIR